VITPEDLTTYTNDELTQLQQLLNLETVKPWRTVKTLQAGLENVLPYKGKSELDNLEPSDLLKDEK